MFSNPSIFEESIASFKPVTVSVSFASVNSLATFSSTLSLTLTSGAVTTNSPLFSLTIVYISPSLTAFTPVTSFTPSFLVTISSVNEPPEISISSAFIISRVPLKVPPFITIAFANAPSVAESAK